MVDLAVAPAVAVLADDSNHYMEVFTMKNFAITLGIILLIIILCVGICYSTINNTYKNLALLEENINLQYSQIETNLQRRMDLIPNFVEVVKGYASHEEAVFTEIAEARAQLAGSMESGDTEAISEANSKLDSALSRLLVITENYPELKASEHFTALQDELAGTENRIAVSRQYYNEAVNTYNSALKDGLFTVFLANLMGFEKAEYFESAYGSETAPTFSFD